MLCPESGASFSTDTNPSCLLAHFIAYFNPFALPCCYCCCWDSPFFRLSAEQKQIMKSKQTSHNINGNEFIMRDVFSVYSSCAAVCFFLFFLFFLMPVINFWAKANAHSHTHTHSYVGSKKAHTHLQLTGKQLTHFVVATFLWQLSGSHSTCALLRCFFIALPGCDSDSDSPHAISLALSLPLSLSLLLCLSCVSDEFWLRIHSICVHIVQYYTSA